ncbi:MAG: MucB/RseB C-terminal domain-containing protein [Halioglobus sp.]
MYFVKLKTRTFALVVSAKIRLPLVLLLATCGFSLPASADGCPGADAKALEWIGKMSDSAHQQSYHGVVTRERGSDLQVMRITRSIGENSSFESLTHLTGQSAKVERSGHPLDCVHPGHKVLALGANLEAGSCEITQHYRFRMASNERVAGRDAVRVRVEPRDMYRYGYQLSLDAQTGLLLKTVVVSTKKRALEKFQFANVSFQSQADSLVEVDVSHTAGHPDPNGAGSDLLAPLPWNVTWVPDGFVATDSATGRASRRTYTDGLAVFSVFLEYIDGEIPPGEGLVRNGGTTSYTKGLTLDGHALLVTVIGEVPVYTVRMVAESIRWAN